MSQSFQSGNIEERRRHDGTLAFRVRYWVRTAAGEWKRKTATLPRRVKTRKQADKEVDNCCGRSTTRQGTVARRAGPLSKF